MYSTRSFHGIGRTERLNIKGWLTIDYAIGFALVIFSLNLFLVWTMGMKTYFAEFFELISKKHLLLSIPWVNISYYYKLSYIFITSNINVSGILKKYVSKIVKSLKFYSHANNLSATVLWMLIGGMTLLGQRQDNLVLKAIAIDRISAFSY